MSAFSGFGTASEDGYYQADLALAALKLASHILKNDGTFVVKVWVYIFFIFLHLFDL